jgi:3-oxoacyl-[acyl-carrier-protein] synthase II
MKKRVVITGYGCVSALGNNVKTTWKNILDGKSGAGPITQFPITEEFSSRIGAEVKDFDPVELFGRKEARRMDRYTQFALASSQQALDASGLSITDENRDRIGAVIGTGIGGILTLATQLQVLNKRGPKRVSPFLVPMMIPDSAGSMIAIQFGLRGPNFAVVTACATGTNAIGEAAEVIRRGQADVMFAGGSEAAFSPLALAGLGSMTALSTRNDDPQAASRPFDKDRDGFLISEGSAVLVLESLEHAQTRNATIFAEVLGYGSNNDAFHISAPAENGHGAFLCMRMALKDAKLKPTQIDYINAHGTSTPLNDKNETAAIKTCFGDDAYNIPVSSTKSMTGHLMGASGALEALFCVLAIQDNILPPTINYTTPDPECDLDYVPNQARRHQVNITLSNSFGFGGHNAAIILGRYQAEEV